MDMFYIESFEGDKPNIRWGTITHDPDATVPRRIYKAPMTWRSFLCLLIHDPKNAILWLFRPPCRIVRVPGQVTSTDFQPDMVLYYDRMLKDGVEITTESDDGGFSIFYRASSG